MEQKESNIMNEAAAMAAEIRQKNAPIYTDWTAN